ncbi:MAG: hypothetical protein UX02_C0001G0041 [Candidatus Moranbacteria bacterium GW2011_GWC1_45_18]|nr:MAG: hypothetical protein UT79_C0002G0356 [Candidatus Moranbacteria bacterium GW2011_GWC2_40_12]KKU00593.1 MAG: hypothetical protein UX02_C0001G0041 [Candidatus Moranbacteria bacterium GW2011_GWC1_45_18]HBB36677.1 hypothetical protein [Candidatus Moranbacteria bacterium]HBU25081.1 hypothetical protein [Candidatus Moranbacteria bacterium]
MKKILFVISILAFGFIAVNFASAYSYRVGGYYRSSGTYVQPYYRTSPDSSRWNNYSTRGNYNPYTGQKGYTSPYRSYNSYRSYSRW